MALSDNLISYWSLDEASGNAIDAHGSNDLTETSGIIASAAGKVGNARDIERGDTEWFAIASNSDLTTGDIDWTFSIWINPESLLSYVIAAKSFSGSNIEWYLDRSSSKLNLWVNNAGASVSTAGDVSAGSWFFVVVWHDSVNNEIGISVNDSATTTPYSGGIATGDGDFELGGTSAGLQFDGLIDEAGFWKRVLTSGERTELYNSGSGRDYAYITAAPGGHPAIKRMGGVTFAANPWRYVHGGRAW